MMTSQVRWRHHAIIYEFKKYVRDTTSVQKLKIVLAFNHKKTSFLAKTPKKVKCDVVIFFDIMTSLPKFKSFR